MPDGSLKAFLSSRESSALLGVSLRTVPLWTEKGVLRAWKTSGGHRRIERESVEWIFSERQRSMESEIDRDALGIVVVALFRAIFKSWPCPVRLHLASDGFHGLLAIGRLRPDVILTNLAMPGTEGYEMVRELKRDENHGNPEIVVVTGCDGTAIEAHGGLPEDVPVYYKPAPMGVIRRRLEQPFGSRLGVLPAVATAARGKFAANEIH